MKISINAMQRLSKIKNSAYFLQRYWQKMEEDIYYIKFVSKGNLCQDYQEVLSILIFFMSWYRE